MAQIALKSGAIPQFILSITVRPIYKCTSLDQIIATVYLSIDLAQSCVAGELLVSHPPPSSSSSLFVFNEGILIFMSNLDTCSQFTTSNPNGEGKQLRLRQGCCDIQQQSCFRTQIRWQFWDESEECDVLGGQEDWAIYVRETATYKSSAIENRNYHTLTVGNKSTGNHHTKQSQQVFKSDGKPNKSGWDIIKK